MEKTYKVTYKIYFNGRLKPVSFHGRIMHPLYIQINFDRKAIYFKSYYFDLLSRPQFALRHITGNKFPDIAEVRTREEHLIDFIIEKNTEHFSLDLFKEKYDYYCRDLLDLMEGPFKEYLYIFFYDEGLAVIASMIRGYGMIATADHIINDLKTALKPIIFAKLLENAVFYAPPYIPLYSFANEKKKGQLITFSVYEWEQLERRGAFFAFLTKSFPEYEKKTVERLIKDMI